MKYGGTGTVLWNLHVVGKRNDGEEVAVIEARERLKDLLSELVRKKLECDAFQGRR